MKPTKLRLSLLMTALLSTVFSCAPAGAAPPAVPHTMPELRELRLKQLYRREPRAKEFVEKLQQKVSALRAGKQSSTAQVGNLSADSLQSTLDQTILSAGALTEDRLRSAVDFLGDLSGPSAELSAQDMTELADSYGKLCAQLDDQIFIKDLDDALVLHDQLVERANSLVWDKKKIAAEIDHIKQKIDSAPPIPYGRQELLRALQDKRLAMPAKGCYLGVVTADPRHLSSYRPSVGVMEEASSAIVTIEAAHFPVYDTDGHTVDLDQANRTPHVLSPPLLLWAKCRLLEGHVPAITLDMVTSSDESNSHAIQDVLDGKLDEYLNKNLKLLSDTKAATMVGLFDHFDRLAASAFGADGKTPYYLLIDSKLAKLPQAKQQEEAAHRMAKGALTKDIGAELKKYYGDPAVPDGPERVLAAWKHIRSLATTAGAQTLSFYSLAGAYHGNKKALSECPTAGAQDWNKLQHYCPNESVLDWVGISDMLFDPEKAKGAITATDKMGEFMTEIRSSNWHSTPLILSGSGPAKYDPLSEEKWISHCFQELIPTVYPEVKACALQFPSPFSLEAPDGLAAFRRCVTSNQFYKQKPHLVPAQSQQASSSQ